MADILNRTGGPFLDQIEVEVREQKSARIENREPNYALDNLSGAHQIPHLILDVDVTSNDSIDGAITTLVAAKAALEPSSEPASLHPEVVDPTLDPSVEVEKNLAASLAAEASVRAEEAEGGVVLSELDFGGEGGNIGGE